MVSDKKIKAYALKNAIAYKGKAAQGAVVSGLFNEGLKKTDMKTYGKKISEIINEVNKMSLDEQKKEYEKLKEVVSEREIREGLPELPNAEKGVVMRFAPSPSGSLHVIHGLNTALSYDYVLKYGGKFYLRIEDTNPENIDVKAYKLIEEDVKWLTKGKAKIVIQSERMKLYYKYAEKSGSQWTIKDLNYQSGYPALSLSLDSNGSPHVAIVTVDTGNAYRLKHASLSGTEWRYDNIADNTNHCAIAVDQLNKIHLVYETDSGELKYATK